eukprot:228799_1
MLQVKTLSKFGNYILGHNPLRCIASLKQEHIRIKSTMQSFDKLLDKMQYESHAANIVSKEHLKDMQKFLRFNQLYCGQHVMKEDILCKHVSSSDSKLDQWDMKSEYIFDTDGQDKVNKSDNVMIPSKSHIHELYDHMTKEDTVLFPEIIINLNESEMEQISKSFDQCDNKNFTVINAMEILSDHLISKYN